VIETIRQGLQDEGYSVSISRLCRWFEVPRRTVYYRPSRKKPVLQERFTQPIKQMIEENPSFGYRTVAYLLKFQQEHRTAHFPADALAGEEAAGRLPSAGKGNAVTSFGAQ